MSALAELADSERENEANLKITISRYRSEDDLGDIRPVAAATRSGAQLATALATSLTSPAGTV